MSNLANYKAGKTEPSIKPNIGYVAYYFVRYQDGSEEGGQPFDNLENALAWCNRVKSDNRENIIIKLFTIGEEVPLIEDVIKHEEVKVTEKRVIKVKQ